jgi:acyl-CoA thioesterase I
MELGPHTRQSRSGGLARHIAAAVLAAAMLVAFVPGDAMARTIKLVALGDSLTAGYGLAPGEGFPAVLERALKERGRDVEIADAGVSGDTVAGGAARLDWAVPEGTDGVILELGANDALRGLDPDAARTGLDGMMAKLTGRGVDVLLAGMYAPRNMGAAYYQRFDAIYPELARKHDAVLYPFFLDGVAGDRNLNLPDGIHPTAEGIRLIVDRMLPTVEKFLDRIESRS